MTRAGRMSIPGPGQNRSRCGQDGRARAPEKAGRRSGGSPLLCGEEPCGMEPELRRRKAGWRAPERERPDRNTGGPWRAVAVNSIRSAWTGEPSSDWRSLSGRASIRWQPGGPWSSRRWLETEWPEVLPQESGRPARVKRSSWRRRPKNRLAGVRASVVAWKRVTTVERRDAGKWMGDEPERRRKTGGSGGNASTSRRSQTAA
jgi:hypothetical protein